MSTPPPRKKKNPTQPLKGKTGPLPAGKKRAGKGAKGKRKAKKKPSMLPQLVGGLTLLGLVGGGAGLAIYLTNQAIPEVKPVDAGSGPGVARPSIEPQLPSATVKRPGLAARMPDEIYFPKALDVAGSPIEAPVQGLLSRHVITLFADGQYRPAEPVTRAQFVSWCYNAIMAQTTPGPDPFKPPKKAFKTVAATGAEFGDVPEDHWAAGVLATVKASGVLGGNLTSFFRPDAPLSREEWLVLASAFGATVDQKAALAAALEEGPIQVAYRQLNYTDYEKLKPAFKPYVGFVFGDEARRAWVAEAFGVPGTPGPWHPGQAVTRGEAAVWIGAVYEQIGHMAF